MTESDTQPLAYPPPRSAAITAVVVFRNERDDLARSLPALRFCDEVIAVNMASTDGSLDVAKQHADAVYDAPLYRIHEPARAAAIHLARHDWVLMVDPDEVFPPSLCRSIVEAMPPAENVGLMAFPMWYYLADRRLEGSYWGRLMYMKRLIHRGRCVIHPQCHSRPELAEGMSEARIEHDGENHIRHYWSPSYADLLMRHFWRYPRADAASKVAGGERLTWDKALRQPWRCFRSSFRTCDGWRDFPRGWILSLIYGGYQVASHWPMLWYQAFGVPDAVAESPTPPTLTRRWMRGGEEAVGRADASPRAAA